jgi:hypothetical protein
MKLHPHVFSEDSDCWRALTPPQLKEWRLGGVTEGSSLGRPQHCGTNSGSLVQKVASLWALSLEHLSKIKKLAQPVFVSKIEKNTGLSPDKLLLIFGL